MTMKTLLILRHAQALSTEIGQTDKDRKLSDKGIDDSRALGRVMVQQGLRPDAAICSTAIRTRATLAGVTRSCDINDIRMPDALYNSPDHVLLSHARETDDAANSLLIVAHNPGIHMFAARLVGENGPQSLLDRLGNAYAPATLTVLECDITHWSDLNMGQARLMGLLEAIDYNAPNRPTRWM